MHPYIKRKIAGLKYKMQQKGVILMYHRVAEVSCDPWDLAVSPSNFEQHLKVLKKHKIGIPLFDLYKRLKTNKIGYNSLAITFDDGYADNHKNAAPLLSKYNIPATFFITTANIDAKREFWWDALERLIFYSRELPSEFTFKAQNQVFKWSLENDRFWQKEDQIRYASWKGGDEVPTQRHHLFLEIWKVLKFSDYNTQLEILSEIKSLLPSSIDQRSENFAMNNTELSVLNDNDLFEIGAHTLHHPSLPGLVDSGQKLEIEKSKSILESITGKELTGFAYPYGDYNQHSLKCTQNAGFIYACTTEGKCVVNGQSPYALSRFQVKNWDAESFEKHLRLWFNKIYRTI